MSYPGEDAGIPSRIIEALEDQPLSYLVPKDGLAALVNAPMRTSLPFDKTVFTRADDGRNVDINYLATTGEAKISIKNDVEHNKLIFKKPDAFTLSTKPIDYVPSDLFEGLSPLAKGVLSIHGELVGSDNIEKRSEVLNKVQQKHKLEDLTPNTSNLSFDGDSPNKKTRISTGITMTQANLAEQYLSDLRNLLDILGLDQSSAELENIEYWLRLPNEKYILTTNCLIKLQLTIKNITANSQLWDSIKMEWLLRLLDVMVSNIMFSKKALKTGLDDSMLRHIALLSTVVLFNIFLLGRNDNNLHRESYIMEPLNFLSDLIESLRIVPNEYDSLKIELNAFQEALGLLPKYIYNGPFLDDNVATKLVYIFSDLLMSNDIETTANIQFQNFWDNVKRTSSEILVSLFTKLDQQREFIIEELISHIEKLPKKRTQKKLRKIKNENIYITDFTFTLMSMLENINCYTFCGYMKELTTEHIESLKNEYKNQDEFLSNVIEHINHTILERFFKNPSSLRYVIDNFVQDLLLLIPYPQWPVTEKILSSLLKRFMKVFSPSIQVSANIETICLQHIGNIGSTIFDIKCSTRDHEDNNLIKMINYPENLPHFFTLFDECILYNEIIKCRDSATRFLWNLRLGSILRLAEYTKDVKDQNSTINGQLKNILEHMHDSGLERPSKTKKTDFGAIRLDYFSVLHAFELLNLYDPYLKLILSLLAKDKIKLRSTAIKCLSMLASKDKVILSNPMVKATIQQRLNDSSASVKDAILDLVSINSSYFEFYQQINNNYDDDSIMVRKHVLRINERMYDETNDIATKVYVIARILMKIEDEEDNIIDMARLILLQRWILMVDELMSQPEKLKEISASVLNVISRVATMNEKCSQLFDWFLNFFLLNKEAHTKDMYDKITHVLKTLTDFLVQRIVELNSEDINEKGLIIDKHNLLNLLAKFADSTVSFLTKDHITALYPYMVSDEKSDFHYHILQVFRSTFEKLANFKPKFLYDLETTLLSRLPKMNVREIDEAMPLIWSVATHRSDTTRVAKACSSCLSHLHPYISKANKEETAIVVDGKLQRLIYLATGFARFCFPKIPNDKIAFLQEDETLYEHITKCLLVLSKNKITHVIRRVALKNLTKLCGNHPKLFNSRHVLHLLDKEFQGDQLDIKLVILESLYDLFLLEERKSVRNTGVSSTLSSNSILKKKLLKTKKADFVNDGVCSALATRFLNNILQLCLLRDLKNSLVAIRLLKLILKFGYTNPSHSIPTVIALIASDSQFIRHVAYEILEDLFEKYETLVFSGLSRGITKAIHYSIHTGDHYYYKHDYFLASLEKLCGTGKKNAPKFFKIMKRITQSYLDDITDLTSTTTDVQKSIFVLCANITNITFTSQYDLVSLLKTIDLTTDRLKEIIMDEIDDASPLSKSEELYGIILIQLCLQDFGAYLLHMYGLKNDMLLLDIVEESELKNKQLPTKKQDIKEFSAQLENIEQHSSNGTLIAYFKKHVKDT
ncbi:scc2p [Saccharomyces arboricola H-6]|uniref:Sister chromatid cohesion protein n=1 Tax=Saccharomyces arboricola (strain H-6 / AS 2.3317 / CBS 10644) TaxID=1160507 RepID=J8PJP3_SACAR|nr:scc2p [Saccharomyces arboricola H-6]